MLTWHVVLGVSFWVMGLLPSEVGPAYPSAMFTPAMPGNTPNCVKDPRDTYCTEPKKYPKERIVYLLENKMYDLDSLLTDETRDSYTFEARDIPNLPLNMYSYDAPKQSYGPPKPSPGYLPPRQNYTTTSKPGYVPPPSTKYGPPPSHFYDQPTPSRGYGPPPPIYDSDGPYPRYPKAPPNGSYLPTRYSPPTPRYPPKPQPWWMKIVRSGSLRRQKRQTTTDLCPYESEYIMPRAALNNKGDWMFLVNVNEVSSEYTQLVESKKCITNTCTGSCNVPDGFTAVCQQQYVQKRLIALDGSGSRLATDTFWFPSCCVCKLNPSGG
ncbi:protein spaetzle 5-like isoform X2 [Macrobrachium nipponense]|uniref:protein spaetzle 5-like isoform X2 n=1 Tax=Macrobrachium nipponense TaxID=159736 RepID=UPI0030C8C8B7